MSERYSHKPGFQISWTTCMESRKRPGITGKRAWELWTKDAFSGVRYDYDVKNETSPVKKLQNTFHVINEYKQFSQQEEMVGVDVDHGDDSREMTSKSISGGLGFNNDNFMVGIIPIITMSSGPMKPRRSPVSVSGINRVINRYGIQKRTVAYEQGATYTENILLDQETGEVLLTRTQNEFNDYVYQYTYPAHWVADYDGHGQASQKHRPGNKDRTSQWCYYKRYSYR